MVRFAREHDTGYILTNLHIFRLFHRTRHVALLLVHRPLFRFFVDLFFLSSILFPRECRLVSWRNDRKNPNIPNWRDSKTGIGPAQATYITFYLRVTCYNSYKNI